MKATTPKGKASKRAVGNLATKALGKPQPQGRDGDVMLPGASNDMNSGAEKISAKGDGSDTFEEDLSPIILQANDEWLELRREHRRLSSELDALQHLQAFPDMKARKLRLAILSDTDRWGAND